MWSYSNYVHYYLLELRLYTFGTCSYEHVFICDFVWPFSRLLYGQNLALCESRNRLPPFSTPIQFAMLAPTTLYSSILSRSPNGVKSSPTPTPMKMEWFLWSVSRLSMVLVMRRFLRVLSLLWSIVSTPCSAARSLSDTLTTLVSSEKGGRGRNGWEFTKACKSPHLHTNTHTCRISWKSQ